MKQRFTILLRVSIFLTILLVIGACQFTFSEANQPTTGYANNRVLTTLRVDELQSLSSASFTISMQIPINWEVENNSFYYEVGDSETNSGIATFNSVNTASLGTADAGYKWWSGETLPHSVLGSNYAMGYISFLTSSDTGDYLIDYYIGDSSNEVLTETYILDVPITIVDAPIVSELTNQDLNLDAGMPWDIYVFMVDYHSNSVPETTKIVIDDIEYDMSLMAGVANAGKYRFLTNNLAAGEHNYYFVFDGTIRFPETGVLIGPSIQDQNVQNIPFNESFEISSTTKDFWTVEDPWEIAIPLGLAGDPTTAYSGDYCAGMDLTNDGLVNTTSEFISPIIDGTETDTVFLSFQSWTPEENMTYSIMIYDMLTTIGTGLQIEEDLLANNWNKITLDISSHAAGKYFQARFIGNVDEESIGWAVDEISFDDNIDYFSELIFENSKVSGYPDEQLEFLFTIENLGELSENFNFTFSNDIQFGYSVEEFNGTAWSSISTSSAIQPGEIREFRVLADYSIMATEDNETIIFTATGINNPETVIVRSLTSVIIHDYILDNGYAMYTSHHPDGPAFNWEEPDNASQVDIEDYFTQDNHSIGFGFEFYGNSYYDLYYGEDGYFGFLDYMDSSKYTEIPNSDEPNVIVAPFWSTLYYTDNTKIYEELKYIDGELSKIITFEDISTDNQYEENDTFSFQVILNEKNEILFQYDDFSGNFDPTYATIGIEENGSAGIQFQYDCANVSEDLAILFSPNYVAHNPSPENNLNNFLSTAGFNWENSDQFETVNVYLRIGTGFISDTDLIHTGSLVETINNDNNILGLLEQTEYSWRVDGILSDGTVITGNSWTFYTTGNVTALSGYVYDAYDNSPVEGAIISTINPEGGGGFRSKNDFERIIYSTTSNAYGSYSLSLPGDYFYVEVMHPEFIGEANIYVDATANVEKDFTLNRINIGSRIPRNGLWDVGLYEGYSWENYGTVYNHTVVEVSENSDMSGAVEVYSGNLISSLSGSAINSAYGGLQNSTYYYWRVTLSVDNTSKFAPSDIFYYISEYDPEPPVLEIQETISGGKIASLTQSTAGYLTTLYSDEVGEFNSIGQLLWRQSYSALPSGVFIKALEADDGDIILGISEADGDIYGDYSTIAKVNSSGTVLWQQHYKYQESGMYSNEIVTDIIQDSAGNYLLAGATGFNDWDFLLTKTSGNTSTPSFQISYGADGYQEQCNDVLMTTDGGYLLTGYRAGDGTNPTHYSNVKVIKTNTSGTVIWEYVEGFGNDYEGRPSSGGYSAINTDDGGYLITAYMYDSDQYSAPNIPLVIKLDSSGNKEWAKSYPSVFYGEASCAQIADGGYLIGGSPDLIKIDIDGNLEWIIDNYSDDVLWKIENMFVDGDGRIIIADEYRFMIYGEGVDSLDPPQNVVIEVEPDGITKLTWDSVPGAISYKVYSDTYPNGSFNTLEKSDLSVTTWTDINPGEKKFYRVVASTDAARILLNKKINRRH